LRAWIQFWAQADGSSDRHQPQILLRRLSNLGFGNSARWLWRRHRPRGGATTPFFTAVKRKPDCEHRQVHREKIEEVPVQGMHPQDRQSHCKPEQDLQLHAVTSGRTCLQKLSAASAENLRKRCSAAQVKEKGGRYTHQAMSVQLCRPAHSGGSHAKADHGLCQGSQIE